MPDEVAISMREVSKMYRLFASPHERLKEALHPLRKRYHHEFWALNGVSFDVPKGQTVGIIGRNGSGKSTLLQIIAGILRPASGSVTVNGRVSALLELGAGFNPDFTGRENVMLHGAIMGLPRDEVLRRVPEIEAFADIGQFFDQRVKTYSSGMFVRLAFSVAIHVEPDILLIDEALAVGDARFQSKCFGRIQDFQEKGKTILLVSHSADAIANHCTRALLLHDGHLLDDDAPSVILPKYYEIVFTGSLQKRLMVDQQALKIQINELRNDRSISSTNVAHDQIQEAFFSEATDVDMAHQRTTYNPEEHRFGDGRAIIVDYLIVANGHSDPASIHFSEFTDLYMKVHVREPIKFPMVGYSIKSVDGITLAGQNTRHANISLPSYERGDTIIYHWQLQMFIAPCDVFVDFGVAEKLDQDHPADVRKNIVQLKIISNETLFEGLVGLPTKFCEFIKMKRSVLGSTF